MSALEQSKPKIRTMEELSSTIGISRPTLSKFFQDARSVRSSTKEKIEKALDTVHYVPNFFATKMNRQSTRIIGVIVPYLNDLFFTSLIQSIEESALKRGYTVIIQSAHGDPELEIKSFENLMSMSADGVIAAPIGQASSQNTIARLKEELPVVFVDSRFPNKFIDVDFVGTNNQQSISLMVEYLHRSGSAPVYLSMPRLNSNSLEREEAYLSSAARLGFEPHIVAVDNITPVWDFEAFAYDTMDAYFARGEYVNSTVLCANDRLAIGLIRAANRHHLLGTNKMESKFRVAGHDDHPLSAYVWPALTTVSRNTDGIGRAAVEQILDQIENGRRTSGNGVVRTFDAELRLRESA